jgi:hypothetical protein
MDSKIDALDPGLHGPAAHRVLDGAGSGATYERGDVRAVSFDDALRTRLSAPNKGLQSSMNSPTAAMR